MNKVDSNNIMNKLEYLGLSLDKIPKILKNAEPLEFRIPKFYDDKQYRQYKFIPIKDIQILVSPTNKNDSLEEKYKKARPLGDYLNSKNEESMILYTKFLNLLKNLDLDELEEIEKEQENLNKKLPFKVKFAHNHLWQIYYSENTEKYFMIVTLEDMNQSTFFYLLKKQIEKGRSSKIFVPIRNIGYSTEILNKQQLEDIENYMWLFTKDWPFMYEVDDKNDEKTIQIVGRTEIYDKIKSDYKIVINNKEEGNRLYKLLKALFIIQTELPNYFGVTTYITKIGELEFYIGNQKMVYEEIPSWITEEYDIGREKIVVYKNLITENLLKLDNMKKEAVLKELEYVSKEKQISTFLECKKTFFGKFKYYFKYSNKSKKGRKLSNKAENKNNKEILPSEFETEINQIGENIRIAKIKKIEKKEKYTLEELLQLYKDIEQKETELKNIVMDLNALKLKNKNLDKKIENATSFIEEIDNHKKSIFEFWKYTNKDQMSALPEGEKEEINVVKKIEKVFDFEEDIEKFGRLMDKQHRRNLSKEELDAVYITTTNVLEVLNKLKNKITVKELEIYLKYIKTEAIEAKTLTSGEEFDIFGGMVHDNTKVSKIKNTVHRELPKDKFNILEIAKSTAQIAYKMKLEEIIVKISNALEKSHIVEDISVYKYKIAEKLDSRDINIYNINPKTELREAIKQSIAYGQDEIEFYKIKLPKGTNGISFTNGIFYDNQNKTLPLGQDLSTKILVDTQNIELEIISKKTFNIMQIDKSVKDFDDLNIKKVTVFEYGVKK